jgi:hypothetical protein
MEEHENFLEQLFGNKSDDLNIVIYMLPAMVGKFFNTVEGACKYINEVKKKPNQNIFFGCGLIDPKVKSGRGKKENVRGIGGFWADIDFQSGHKPDCPTDLKAVEGLLYGHGCDPTHLVHTGNGVHAWWMFKEPWEFKSKEEADAAETMNNRVQETILKRCREKGWTIDKTHDLTRVLRPPGTFNRKDMENIMETKILKSSDALYADPKELDEYIITEDEIKRSKEIDKKVTARIENDLKIDPDANPPSSLMQEMFEVLPQFKASWNAERPDFKKQSPSEYALSLATFAAQAAWSDQEIANLIIAFYRRHKYTSVFKRKPDLNKAMRGDYLSRTIALARAEAIDADLKEYCDTIGPTIGTPYEKKLDPDGETGKKRVCQALGLDIYYVTQIRSLKDSKYIMKVQHFDSVAGCKKNAEVSFDSAAQFLDQTRFQNRVFEVTKVFRPLKKIFWENAVKKNWEKFMVVQEDGPQSIRSRLREWFNDYLKLGRQRSVEDATLDKLPFIHDDHWHVHPGHLNTWAMSQGYENLNRNHTSADLKAAECIPVRYNAINPMTEKRTSVKGFYMVPHDVLIPPPQLKIVDNCKPETKTETDLDDDFDFDERFDDIKSSSTT